MPLGFDLLGFDLRRGALATASVRADFYSIPGVQIIKESLPRLYAHQRGNVKLYSRAFHGSGLKQYISRINPFGLEQDAHLRLCWIVP